MADDYDVALLKGLAVLLHTAGVGVWRETSAYTGSERAITLDGLPQTPISAISLSAYPLADSLIDHASQVGVQVVCREPGPDPTVARATAGRVFRTLHDRTHLRLTTGLHVVQLYRQSAVSGGREADGSCRSIQNFYADVHTPPPEETNP
ncbi:MAG: minor capsid protein [Aeromicrobium sp.]|uniref:hypothetical protein n=1 Tax=Aeromicrobium sp. TaxID=1871063 RepID=UPI0039E3C4D6